MSTKTSVTKKTAPKGAKAPSPEAATEKNSKAKAVKSAVVPEESPAGKLSKAAKSPLKAKPETKTAPGKPVQEAVAAPAVKRAATAVTKEAATVEPPVTQVPSPVGNDPRWQEIRLILEKLKETTIREIRKSVKIGTEAVAAIEPGGDIYDQASSERDRELGLLLGDREREKIHSIDEALLRIDEGEYGICEECDEEIPLGRLKAMPFTRHCVKCKSDLEKLQAQTKRVEEERAYREIPLGVEDEES